MDIFIGWRPLLIFNSAFHILHSFISIFYSLLLKEEIAESAQLQLAEVSLERQRLRDTSEALEIQLKNVLHARYCMCVCLLYFLGFIYVSEHWFSGFVCLDTGSTNILLRESDAAFLIVAPQHSPLEVTLPNGSTITSLLCGTFRLPNLQV